MGICMISFSCTSRWSLKGSGNMLRQKLGILSLLGVLLSFSIFGCGANPGGDLDGIDITGQIPNGIDEKISAGYDSLESGQNNTARLTFNIVIQDSPNTKQKSQAYVGVAYADTRDLGSSEGLAEFKLGYEQDSTNPDARVGYAGALITRGRSDDILLAIELIEGLDTGNPNFVYEDVFNLGISNAEVHALLAYAYKAAGSDTKSAQQAAIAAQLDASVDNTTVDQILDVLAFIP